ncbi:hypothetical protein FSP39_002443 [Pinctada imbricata]|uniref:BZIP domain-containing protein n=1 Tax=Pinctada imbricata TaxID=66713 RepID=A0AA89BPK8_PINIB|nr:hypothetical protein FSP39_002443 [Pinctada imbricata]
MDLMIDMEEYQLFEDLDLVDDSFSELSTPGSVFEQKNVVGSSFPGDGLIGHRIVIDQEGQDALEDLLQLNDSHNSEGTLDSDWMENIEISQFLGPNEGKINTVSLEKPVETSVSYTSRSVLHELLTQPIVQKSTSPPSPEAQVAPQLSQFDFLESEMAETDIVQMAVADIVASSSNDANIAMSEVLPEISFDSGIADTSMTTDSSTLSGSVEHQNLLDFDTEDLLGSPLSAEDIDSLLGSEPSSPSQASDDDPDYVPCEEKTLVTKSKPGRKTTAVPYEKPLKGLDRKERKKLQNKNAAIRYRMKKREEKGSLVGEMDELANRNKELKDQVDSITREIKYMKDLITEVCKAKGLKVTFKK